MDNSFHDLLSRLREAHDNEVGKLLSKIQALGADEDPVSDDNITKLSLPEILEDKCKKPATPTTPEPPSHKEDVAWSIPLSPEQDPPTLLSPKASKSAIENSASQLSSARTKESADSSQHSQTQSQALSFRRYQPSWKSSSFIHSAHRATKIPDHLRKQFTNLNLNPRVVKARNSKAWKGLEVFVAIAIMLNAIFVGLEVWWKSNQTGSACDDSGALKALDVANLIFFCLFLVDLLVRIGLERLAFICSPAWKWNLFDFIVVLTMLLDQFIPGCSTPSGIKSPAMLRTFRLVRVFRVFRVVKNLKELREFNVVVEALTRSFFTLVSCAGPLAISLYICAIILTNSQLDDCNQDDSSNSILCEHFGTLGRSVITLYAATLSGLNWYQIISSLWTSSLFDFVIFFFYMTFSLLIVLNTITAMLVVKEHRCAWERRAFTLKEDQAREQSQMMELLNRIFHDLDTNGNQGISRTEFMMALHDENRAGDVTAWLGFLDLGGTKPEVLFDLIDMNGDGEISLQEFAAGCYWLRGAAKNIDSVKLLNDIDTIRCQLSKLVGQNNDDEDDSEPPNEPMYESSEPVQPVKGPAAAPVAIGGKGRHGIKAPEDRAMTLTELQQLRMAICARCIRECWVDGRTRLMLRPDLVNLYSLCYNFVAPATVPDGVILNGLHHGSYHEGQAVVQIDRENGWRLAEGLVMSAYSKSRIRVRVVRGRFVPNSSPVFVADVMSGVPSDVVSLISWSYKELISQTPTKPQWYCCHWWGERVNKFVTLCEVHARYYGLKPARATFWICGYANNQHTLGDEIGCDPQKSSFQRALKAANGVLLVLDRNAEAFSRIWCDYEIYTTICDKDRKLDIMTAKDNGELALISEDLLPKEQLYEKSYREQQFPVQLLAKGLQAKLEDGKASLQDDVERILQAIEADGRQDGGNEEGARDRALARANSLLNSYIALRAWPFAVKHRIVNDFDATRPGTISLVDVLKHDTTRADVTLSLAHCKATDEDVQAVGAALPEQLTYLYLSFEDCLVSDVGACDLVDSLPHNLREFSLDFSECFNITDVTLQCLASNMPQKIEHMHLCFANCGDGITEKGAHVLAEGLQHLSKLKVLYANFMGTALNSEYKSLQKFKAIAKTGFLKSMLPGHVDIDEM